MTIKSLVWFAQRNIYGAWVVYGADGIKHYYDCTKGEAVRRYEQECNLFVETKEGNNG